MYLFYNISFNNYFINFKFIIIKNNNLFNLIIKMIILFIK